MFEESTELSGSLIPKVWRDKRRVEVKKMAGVIRGFLKLAAQRASSEVVGHDLDHLADCVLELHGLIKTIEHDQEVWKHYLLSGNQLVSLLEVGKILPFKVCERHQLSPGSRLRKQCIAPSQVGPNCPRFVCNTYFGYLIPADPSYDGWFEWFVLFYHKLLEGTITMDQARRRCEHIRYTSYVEEEEKKLYIQRLVEIESLQRISPQSSFFHSEAQQRKEEVKEETSKVEKFAPREDLPVSISFNFNYDPFRVHFFEWALALAPPRKVMLMATLTTTNERPSFEASLEDTHCLDHYEVARAFYTRAMSRYAMVSNDLSLMISHLIEHGASIEPDSEAMHAVVQAYQLVNPRLGQLSTDTLTLTRVACILPWLVCQYINAHCKDLSKNTDAMSRFAWFAHPYLASLIPRHPYFEPLYRLHLLYRIHSDAATEQLQAVSRNNMHQAPRAAAISHSARQIHQARYLTDSQRIELLRKI